jgi:hypothetical protein
MSAELLDRIHLAVVDDCLFLDFSAYRDEWFFISSGSECHRSFPCSRGGTPVRDFWANRAHNCCRIVRQGRGKAIHSEMGEEISMGVLALYRGECVFSLKANYAGI